MLIQVTLEKASHALCGRGKLKASETTLSLDGARKWVPANWLYMDTCGRGKGGVSETRPYGSGAKQKFQKLRPL